MSAATPIDSERLLAESIAGKFPDSRGRFGGLQFRANVAAQVAVGGLPFGLGVAVDQAVQLALQVPGAMTRELLHERPVNSSDLIQGDGKRLGGGLDMLGSLVPLQSSPREDGGFGRALRLGVVIFKGEEEGLIGIAGKCPQILARREGAIARNEGIVDAA